MEGRSAGQAGAENSPYARRAEAVVSLLIEKEVVSSDEIWRAVDDMDSRTPAQGAKAVARAWRDPSFKARLLEDSKAALAELGIGVSSHPKIVVLENTEKVHHVVVCTLCSCYPQGVLGIPPAWYKSFAYRSRAIADPRGVLKEFGTILDSEVEVRVYDSTADVRYLVIPQRPAGTENMTEQELASLVTRDSMIGVARAQTPGD